MLGSGGELSDEKRVAAPERAEQQVVRVTLCMSLLVLYILLICIFVFTFPLSAVLLNCLYPNP